MSISTELKFPCRLIMGRKYPQWYLDTLDKVKEQRKIEMTEAGWKLRKGRRFYERYGCCYALWATNPQTEGTLSFEDACELQGELYPGSLTPWPPSPSEEEAPSVSPPLFQSTIIPVEPMKSPASLIFFADILRCVSPSTSPCPPPPPPQGRDNHD